MFEKIKQTVMKSCNFYKTTIVPFNNNMDFHVEAGLGSQYAHRIIQENKDVFSILNKHYIPGKDMVSKNTHFSMSSTRFKIFINVMDDSNTTKMPNHIFCLECILNVEGDKMHLCNSSLHYALSKQSICEDRSYFLKLLDFVMSFNEPSVKDLFDIEVSYTNDTSESNLQTFISKTSEYADGESAFFINGSKPREKPAIMYIFKPKFLRR